MMEEKTVDITDFDLIGSASVTNYQGFSSLFYLFFRELFIFAKSQSAKGEIYYFLL